MTSIVLGDFSDIIAHLNWRERLILYSSSLAVTRAASKYNEYAQFQNIIHAFKEQYPGNYTMQIEDFGSRNIKLVFDSPSDEILFMLRYE